MCIYLLGISIGLDHIISLILLYKFVPLSGKIRIHMIHSSYEPQTPLKMMSIICYFIINNIIINPYCPSPDCLNSCSAIIDTLYRLNISIKVWHAPGRNRLKLFQVIILILFFRFLFPFRFSVSLVRGFVVSGFVTKCFPM